ncbi:MAG TPA: hypothetical protein VK983_04945 [Candidatus Limnocylindrales bacterium]|nr:hypothetical protein [Candidatus Limnocylindrales bacterium]
MFFVPVDELFEDDRTLLDEGWTMSTLINEDLARRLAQGEGFDEYYKQFNLAASATIANIQKRDCVVVDKINSKHC